MKIIEFKKIRSLQEIFDTCNWEIDEFFLTHALEKNADLILNEWKHFMLVIKNLEPIIYILGNNLFFKLI